MKSTFGNITLDWVIGGGISAWVWFVSNLNIFLTALVLFATLILTIIRIFRAVVSSEKRDERISKRTIFSKKSKK